MPTFYEAAGVAMRSRATRVKCRQVADRVAAAARSIAAADRLNATITVTEGTRPKGRPFARVTMEGGNEFGASGQPRRRTLARAASASARTGRR